MKDTTRNIKGITVRLYPNKDQVIYIKKLLGCCRFLYNQELDLSTTSYKNDNVSLSPTKRINSIIDFKNRYEFLREVHSKVLQQTVRDLNQAFENFFRHTADYPTFKSKKDNNHSCRFPKDAFIGIKGNRVSLIKTLQDIQFKCSVEDEKYLNKNQNKIRNITLRQTCDGKYYLSFCVDYQPVKKEDNGSVTGLDLGITDFLVDSNGNRVANPHFYTKEERKLKLLKRKHSKKKLLPTGEKALNKQGQLVDVKKTFQE